MHYERCDVLLKLIPLIVVSGFQKILSLKIGSLRPYPQSSKREVPSSIGRPDYADDPHGFPHSEQKVRSSSNIKCLSDEEIESMKVACKVCVSFLLYMHDIVLLIFFIL